MNNNLSMNKYSIKKCLSTDNNNLVYSHNHHNSNNYQLIIFHKFPEVNFSVNTIYPLSYYITINKDRVHSDINDCSIYQLDSIETIKLSDNIFMSFYYLQLHLEEKIDTLDDIKIHIILPSDHDFSITKIVMINKILNLLSI